MIVAPDMQAWRRTTIIGGNHLRPCLSVFAVAAFRKFEQGGFLIIAAFTGMNGQNRRRAP